MHPTGQCTCGGEGECPWCLYTAAQERIVVLQDELRKYPLRHEDDNCRATQSSIICGKCTCGAKERREALLL